MLARLPRKPAVCAPAGPAAGSRGPAGAHARAVPWRVRAGRCARRAALTGTQHALPLPAAAVELLTAGASPGGAPRLLPSSRSPPPPQAGSGSADPGPGPCEDGSASCLRCSCPSARVLAAAAAVLAAAGPPQLAAGRDSAASPGWQVPGGAPSGKRPSSAGSPRARAAAGAAQAAQLGRAAGGPGVRVRVRRLGRAGGPAAPPRQRLASQRRRRALAPRARQVAHAGPPAWAGQDPGRAWRSPCSSGAGRPGRLAGARTRMLRAGHAAAAGAAIAAQRRRAGADAAHPARRLPGGAAGRGDAHGGRVLHRPLGAAHAQRPRHPSRPAGARRHFRDRRSYWQRVWNVQQKRVPQEGSTGGGFARCVAWALVVPTKQPNKPTKSRAVKKIKPACMHMWGRPATPADPA